MDSDTTSSPKFTASRILLVFLAFAAGFLLLFGLRTYNYLLFHTVAELVSIVVAFAIFMLAWPTRRLLSNDFLLFLGFLYLTVGTLDLLHTLSYKGMGILLSNDPNPATQLWIITRFLESLGLLLSPMFIRRRIPGGPALLASTLLLAAAVITVFIWPVFPDCFIEGSGLTPFKKVSEYIISLLVLLAILRLQRQRKTLYRPLYLYLLLSMVFTIMAELFFTLYSDVYDLFNVAGHYFKLISFIFIYKAIIQNGLTKPLDVLFSDLKRGKEMLEERNANLEAEIAHRKETETNLRAITGDLEQAKKDIEAKLFKLTREKGALVAELSEKALKKADTAQQLARLTLRLNECNRERNILHDQLSYYVKSVEQSRIDLGKIIE